MGLTPLMDGHQDKTLRFMTDAFDALGLTVLERGWLSSNSTVITDNDSAWVIDTGYSTHAVQTVELVRAALGDRSLRAILNTHLHSDHCGGNAALQAAFPDARVLIPPGQADAVAAWDEVRLTYQPTGQQCARFTFHDQLQPSTEIMLADHAWQIHAAPGHDPHAVLLYQPDQRVLISGDALWQNGFGVVFPELEGMHAFEEVESTLDLIQQLAPRIVIPGHGSPFTDVSAALARARVRLHQFQTDPDRHREYAAKVLVKFRLLECQQCSIEDLDRWFESTEYFRIVQGNCAKSDLALPKLLDRLVASGAARVASGCVYDN